MEFYPLVGIVPAVTGRAPARADACWNRFRGSGSGNAVYMPLSGGTRWPAAAGAVTAVADPLPVWTGKTHWWAKIPIKYPKTSRIPRNPPTSGHCTRRHKPAPRNRRRPRCRPRDRNPEMPSACGFPAPSPLGGPAVAFRAAQRLFPVRREMPIGGRKNRFLARFWVKWRESRPPVGITEFSG